MNLAELNMLLVGSHRSEQPNNVSFEPIIRDLKNYILYVFCLFPRQYHYFIVHQISFAEHNYHCNLNTDFAINDQQIFVLTQSLLIIRNINNKIRIEQKSQQN